ncbi:MAG: enoyl-CoA hydratase-related protein [Gemmataceae bacterium]
MPTVLQLETLSLVRDADGGVALTLDVPGRGVNVLTRQLFADLHTALDRLAGETRVPVLVVRSGKKSGFLAGADLNEFRLIRDTAAAQAVSASGQQLFARLAAMPFPTAAVIHGPCLGGGLELALACDYRLVVDRANTQLGLPEVELGLLPAWGGTVRLPRVIGLERALQVILAGKRLDAREAFAWGLADAIARTEDELREEYGRLVVRAVVAGKANRRGLPLRTWRQRLLESNPFGRKLIFQATERRLQQRVPDDLPAFAEAAETIRQGLRLGAEGGLAREREAASRLAVSPACRHLIDLFFAREAARKLPPALAEARPVRTVGVVGGGVMGAGIAQLAALAGCAVTIQEVSDTALSAALARVDGLFQKAVARRRLRPDEVATKRAQVRGTTAWEQFDRADLVIEAAVEDAESSETSFVSCSTAPRKPLY